MHSLWIGTRQGYSGGNGMIDRLVYGRFYSFTLVLRVQLFPWQTKHALLLDNIGIARRLLVSPNVSTHRVL